MIFHAPITAPSLPTVLPWQCVKAKHPAHSASNTHTHACTPLSHYTHTRTHITHTLRHSPTFSISHLTHTHITKHTILRHDALFTHTHTYTHTGHTVSKHYAQYSLIPHTHYSLLLPTEFVSLLCKT